MNQSPVLVAVNKKTRRAFFVTAQRSQTDFSGRKLMEHPGGWFYWSSLTYHLGDPKDYSVGPLPPNGDGLLEMCTPENIGFEEPPPQNFNSSHNRNRRSR